jgi:serine/threonine protein kinase
MWSSWNFNHSVGAQPEKEDAMLVPGQTIRNLQLAELLRLNSDEFLVLQVIRGGMGAVAKIQDRDGRLFALKFLELTDGGTDVLERFRREVQVWVTASSCDAVVEVWGTLRINETPVVCAEWMPGGDILPLMKSTEPRSFYSVLDRVIAGLEWVHQEYKIVHRDIKPSNILLNKSASPYIADWGIGKVTFQDERLPSERVAPVGAKSVALQGTLTSTGRIVGTIPYCSPEQILNSSTVDFRSDIYSLGCLMYQWETGAPPFVDSRWEEVARQHLESPVPRIGGFLRRSRLGADPVIFKCLEKNPDDRFTSYSELREALRRQAHRLRISVSKSEISRRRSMPLVGHDQFAKLKPSIAGTKGYGLFERKEIDAFVQEAEALSSVGEWQKACDIYSRLWVPDFYPEDIAEINPNITYAINLGSLLVNLGKTQEAVKILKTIPEPQRFYAAYFVNIGNALNHLGRYGEAEMSSLHGLKRFPDDADILGNLTISLTFQGKHLDALPIALKRLSLERNVHSLEEAGLVLKSIGADLVKSNFPKALEHLANAAGLFSESLANNPLYSPPRQNLARTLFEMGLFSEAMDVASMFPKEPFYGRERGILTAECLNRVGSASECLEFCAKWKSSLKSEVRFLRVEAETIADFYFVGMQTKDGNRVVVPECVSFFTEVIKDSAKRQLSDFGYMARIKEWIGDPAAALFIANQSHELFGDKWEVFHSYAWLHGRTEQWESAYISSKKACELAPWHPPVWRQRSWIEEHLGKSKQAASSRTQGDELSRTIEKMREAARGTLRLQRVID